MEENSRIICLKGIVMRKAILRPSLHLDHLKKVELWNKRIGHCKDMVRKMIIEYFLPHKFCAEAISRTFPVLNDSKSDHSEKDIL